MTMQTSPQGETTSRPAYAPPVGGAYEEWNGKGYKDFVPSERQLMVVEAVKAALAAGKYYSDEVRAFCADYLKVDSAFQQSKGPIRTEGGEFGMDCYYARQYLDAQKKHAANDKAMSLLKPYVGQKLGTLVFNDYKRTTGMTVISVFPETGSVRVTGKRGSQTVETTAEATQIQSAMERAKTKGGRKDGFEEFTYKQPASPAPVAAQCELAEVS